MSADNHTGHPRPTDRASLVSVLPLPTVARLHEARGIFRAHEPRDITYRICSAAMEAAWACLGDAGPLEPIAEFLLVWNKDFYRFGWAKPDAEHWGALEQVIADHRDRLGAWRSRTIEDLRPTDEADVSATFEAFERVVGTTGAAKSLHLLAPRFCPLWSRPIVEEYERRFRTIGGGGLSPGRMGESRSPLRYSSWASEV